LRPSVLLQMVPLLFEEGSYAAPGWRLCCSGKALMLL
jgi:hypothetical protein